MTFADLGLSAPILSALAQQGYQQPSPIQEKAIPPALEGRDVLGCAQTGTGKTCAFAAPILQRLTGSPVMGRPIRALVLTPTRELALQIWENVEAYGRNLPLKSTVIFGGVSQNPQVQALERGVDILVATPGRLGDLYQQGLLDLSRVEIFVLDEADRMLDMGFIHDVKKILKWLPKQKQTMLFSATMPPEIRDLVDSLLHDPVKVAVDPVSSPVEAIDQSVYFVDKGNKTKLLALLVEELGVKNALVFTRTKHGANRVARDLNKAGIPAAAIHGNKSQTARQQALADFKAGKVRCLVATDIAARGLDIEELSHVFNYNLPEVPETYVHRIGRTGRAGREGTAVSFCDFGEKPLLQDIQRLIGREVRVVEDHPYPMVVLEAPKRDKNGRIINAEDDEARQAAREKRAGKKKEAAKAPEAQPAPVQEDAQEPAPAKRRRRRGRKHGETEAAEVQEPQQVQEAPQESGQRRERRKLERPGKRLNTGDAMPRTDFSRPDPFSGDHIMDATARLLAPRKSPVVPTRQESAGHRRRKRQDEETPRQEHRPQQKTGERRGEKKRREEPRSSAPERKRSRPSRRPQPGEPAHASHTKDSTEQKSLMKPYYLDIDR